MYERPKHLNRNNQVRFLLSSLDTGGAEIAFIQIAEELSGLGYSTTIHAILDRGALRSNLSNTVSYKPLSTHQFPSLFPGVFPAFFSLLKLLRNNTGSTFIATLTGTNLLLLLASILTGKKTPVIIVEASTTANRPSALTTYLMRVFYPKASYLVSVSEDVNNDVVSRIGKALRNTKTIVIPNPVDVKSASKKASELPSALKKYEDGRLNLLAVGRLTKAKGLELLIRAYVKSNVSNKAKLIIVGDGELGSDLKDLTNSLGQEKNVFFTGRLNNPYPYFEAADIFVLSSLWEGLPLVLLEAMAMKTPRLILSNCPGSMSNTLGELECVDVFTSGNTDSLSQIISLAVAHDNYPKFDFSEFLDPFLLENVALKYKRLIEELKEMK